MGIEGYEDVERPEDQQHAHPTPVEAYAPPDGAEVDDAMVPPADYMAERAEAADDVTGPLGHVAIAARKRSSEVRASVPKPEVTEDAPAEDTRTEEPKPRVLSSSQTADVLKEFDAALREQGTNLEELLSTTQSSSIAASVFLEVADDERIPPEDRMDVVAARLGVLKRSGEKSGKIAVKHALRLAEEQGYELPSIAMEGRAVSPPGTAEPGSLGAQLEALRVASGLSYEEVAERAGTHPTNVRRVMTGRTAHPQRNNLESYLEVLGATPEQGAEILRIHSEHDTSHASGKGLTREERQRRAASREAKDN